MAIPSTNWWEGICGSEEKTSEIHEFREVRTEISEIHDF
jgi:hypothetical protein